jgi:hypothetical protein
MRASQNPLELIADEFEVVVQLQQLKGDTVWGNFAHVDFDHENAMIQYVVRKRKWRLSLHFLNGPHEQIQMNWNEPLSWISFPGMAYLGAKHAAWSKSGHLLKF